MRLLAMSPVIMSSATRSAVVAKGADGFPAVIFVRTNPGRTTITRTPFGARA